jgi:hypothetical protein
VTNSSEIDVALQALAERGEWHGRAEGYAELVRVEIRRAARRRGIRVRTGVDAIGRPWAVTPDGLPAHEPSRGAAVHAPESGAEDAAIAAAMENWTRPHED